MQKPRDLNHTELIEVVAHEAGVSPYVVERVLRATFDVIGRNVTAGFKVTVTNFGSWYSARRPARLHRNPQTGGVVETGARRYPRFRWAPAVKEATKSERILTTLRKGEVK